MDNQRPEFAANSERPMSQPMSTANPTATSLQQGTASKLKVSDADVQALLTIQNLQSGSARHTQSKSHIGLLVTLVLVVLLAVFASYMLSNLKLGKNATSMTSSTSQSSAESPVNSTSSQINQDVKSCSNLSTAMTQC